MLSCRLPRDRTITHAALVRIAHMPESRGVPQPGCQPVCAHSPAMTYDDRQAAPRAEARHHRTNMHWSRVSASRPPESGQRTTLSTLNNALANGHPRDPGSAKLSRRYYERRLRSLSFPRRSACCPRSCCVRRGPRVVQIAVDSASRRGINADRPTAVPRSFKGLVTMRGVVLRCDHERRAGWPDL
jgi:hypothetical protein